MKITIESTSQVNYFNNVPARLWEGETDSGIKVACWITRVAVNKEETRIEQFEKELKEQAVPSAEMQAFPLRLII